MALHSLRTRAGAAPARDGFEAEAARLFSRARDVMGTEDAAEGMRSFVERSDAVFKGQVTRTVCTWLLQFWREPTSS